MESTYKIRTITGFVSLTGIGKEKWPSVVQEIADFLNKAKETFESRLHVEVQTLRIATDFMSSSEWDHLEDIILLENICLDKGLTFLNAGACHSTDILRVLPDLISRTKITSVSYSAPETNFDFDEALQVADVVLQIAKETDGKGNFRFCASAAADSSAIPYFPVAHACPATSRSFAIGLENGRLLHKALSQCRGYPNDIEHVLREEIEDALKPLCKVARELEKGGLRFAGVDSSIAPGLDDPSIVQSFEAVLGPPYRFGGPGTLSLCARITKALKSVNVGSPLVGYSGIMLPVQEDRGLAASADRKDYSISELLMCSSVCGVGLDTVPCPGPTGDPSEDEKLRHSVARVVLDVATMAHRLKKPLSVRLLPVPGKRAGDRTCFQNPFLIEANILPLENY